MDERIAKFQTFLVGQEKGTNIYDLVMEICTGKPSHTADEEEDEDAVSFSENETLGMVGAAMASVIYRVITLLSNTAKDELERDEAANRIELVRALTDDEGIPLEQAEKMAARTLETIAGRGFEDPAVQKLRKSVDK
jgi:hypothetical protein